MPQIARKIGKIMAEFRGTANEFKATWEREVNFEEEVKLLHPDNIENETVPRAASRQHELEPAAPEVREADRAAIERLRQSAASSGPAAESGPGDKKNWL
jgi:Sec-independent protein translocase protein TatA